MSPYKFHHWLHILVILFISFTPFIFLLTKYLLCASSVVLVFGGVIALKKKRQSWFLLLWGPLGVLILLWRRLPGVMVQNSGSGVRLKVKVAQSCLTLCNPRDCARTVHGLLQARILEWVTFPFSRGSSQPRVQTHASHIAGRFFNSWARREAQESWSE